MIYTVDAPLLLYRPDRNPVLLFSPAGNAQQEDNQQWFNELVGLLRERLDTKWRNEWVAGGLFGAPRQDLPGVLDVDEEPPQSGAAGQTLSSDLVELIEKVQQAKQAKDFNGTIRACQAALERVSASEYGQLWGALQATMGNAFAQNPLGDRAENLEQAIACYRQALEVLTREALPLNSPAVPLVRELLKQARELAGETDEATRSVSLTDPTTGQQRPVLLGAKAGDEAAELSDAARTLSQALETQDAAPQERRINAWIGDQPDQPHPPLQLDQSYTLRFQVGRPVRASLIDDPAAVVRDSDVPPGGLDTRWVIIAQGTELAAVSPEVRIQAPDPNGSSAWSARFELLIPEQGESELRQLRITPRRTGARLEVAIYAGLEPYRQFTVRLDVRQDDRQTQEPVTIENDHSDAPAAQTNLATPHEWATPPGTLTLSILGNVASVMGNWDTRHVEKLVDLPDLEKEAAAPIERVLGAAERFREEWEGYLDNIDPQDLLARLQGWRGDEFWNQLPDHADPAHQRAWEAAARSNELHDLAFQGHWLYETFFPRDSDLRGWLDELPLGARLNVSWQRGPGRIPHVPWGLMYLPEPPAAGQPVDPQGFLALRLRLAYFPYASDARKDLGRLDQCYRVHCLYWGNDATGIEARRQRDRWRRWPNQVFMPSDAAGANPKRDVLQLLAQPEPPPVALLYLFCQAGSPAGSGPRLRFGATPDPEQVLEQRELGSATLTDKPLVFANACATLGGDPYRVNDLQHLFFRRGCRAYLGTEIKVPIQLASRFAALFFHFFYRQAAPEPLAAGEAVVQARLFLWTRFRNIGGLFYSYVNQYELFMADAAEVLAMRRARGTAP